MSNLPLSDSRLLNRPLTLPNGAVLRNRLAKAAMSETLGTYDNRPTMDLVRLYQRWFAARGHEIVLGSPYNLSLDARGLRPVQLFD